VNDPSIPKGLWQPPYFGSCRIDGKEIKSIMSGRHELGIFCHILNDMK